MGLCETSIKKRFSATKTRELKNPSIIENLVSKIKEIALETK